MMSGGLIAPLDDAFVNLKAMREAYQRDLEDILDRGRTPDRIEVPKALVLDHTISGPLQLVAEMSLLKKHGLKPELENIHLLDDELDTDAEHIIYLIRPDDRATQCVVKNVLAHKGDMTQADKQYSVIFMPRITLACEKALDDAGIMGDVTVGEYCMELIPFEEDVLTLELPNSFREINLDGDPSSLFYVASSLMKLQCLFGLIPNIKCKGDNASHVLQMMKRMKRESESQRAFPSGLPSEIDTLVLIDRKVDPISPFVTQFTYEGLIDELIGIKNCYIDVDPEVIGDNKKGKGPKTPAANPKPGPKRKLALNSNDPIFKEIRDLHFSVLGPYLNKKAQLIQDTYDKRHEALTVSEMHSFMQKFKTAHTEHSSLTTHTNVAKLLHTTFVSKKFNRVDDAQTSMLKCENGNESEVLIDEMIARMDPFEEVIRLLCLYSVTNGGLRQKKFDQFKRDIVQTYGFDKMLTLDNLERLGFFTKARGRNAWPALRKNLRLVLDREKMNMQNPQDIAYVHGGYAPLSVRLIELASNPGWKKLEDSILNYLPGKYEEAKQEAMDENDRHETRAPAVESGRKPLTLVYFIGGVTFAEISALRHLSMRENHGREYLIATTKLINGKKLLESVIEKVDNKLQRHTVGN